MAKYDAFISYSRSADDTLAPRVRDGLQELAKPWNKRRALNVFLDRASLELSGGLQDSLHSKLANTDWFILLASTASGRSEWVNAETEYWLATKSADTILLVLTDGELLWDKINSDWDRHGSTVVPEALSGVYDDAPLWLDLRRYRNAPDLDIRVNNDFKNDLATLAATIHGTSKEELVGEDLTQFNKFKRARRIAVAGLLALTLAAVIASVFALVSRDRAVEAEAEAVREAKIATARQVAAQAQVESPDRPDLSWLLAVASEGLGDQLLADGDLERPLVETHAALLATLSATPQLVGYLPSDERVTAIAASPDSGLLATGDASGVVTMWDVATREQLEVIEVGGGSISAVTLSLDGSIVAAGTSDGELSVTDSSTGSHIGGGLAAPATDLVLSDDGRALAVSTRGIDGDAVEVYDLASGEVLGSSLTGLIGVRAMSFEADTLEVIDWSARYSCVVGGECSELELPWSYVARPRPGPSAFNIGEGLGARSELTGGVVQFGDLDGEADRFFELGSGFIAGLEFSPDGNLLVAVHDSKLAFVDTLTAEPVGERLAGIEAASTGVEIVFPTGDGSRIATLAAGKVQLWDRHNASRIGTELPVRAISYPTVAESVVSAAVSADGRRLAWLVSLPGLPRSAEELIYQEEESIALYDTATEELSTLALDGDFIEYVAGVRNLIDFRGDDRLVTDSGRVFDISDGAEVDGSADCVAFGRTVADPSGGIARCEGGQLLPVDLSRFAGLGEDDVEGAVVSDTGSHLVVFGDEPTDLTVHRVDADPIALDLAGDPAAVEAIGAQPDGRPLLEFSPDGELLVVSAWDGGARSLFSTDDGSLLLAAGSGSFDSLAFSPDGSLAAFDRSDGGIEIRTADDLKLVAVLPGDGATVGRVLLFLDGGATLAEATVGGGLTLWDLDPASWTELACSAAGRTLTQDERSRLLPPEVDVDPCHATPGE